MEPQWNVCERMELRDLAFLTSLNLNLIDQLYHSQLRITIKRSFDIFVRRFGIYWKDLQYDLPIVCKIVEATYHLHNFAIRQRVPIPQLDSINSPEVNENNVLVDDMWRNSESDHDIENAERCHVMSVVH